LARVVARVAAHEQVRPMRWPLLREPDKGEAYLLLYKADGDPDKASPMLFRLARKQQARRLPAAGIASVTVCCVPPPSSFRGSTAHRCGPDTP